MGGNTRLYDRCFHAPFHWRPQVTITVHRQHINDVSIHVARDLSGVCE